MKRIHNVWLSPNSRQTEILSDMGIKLPLSPSSLTSSITLQVDEKSHDYQKLTPLISEWGLTDITTVTFTEKELDNSRFLILLSPWTNGYPMPDNNGGYKKSTYDDSNYCSKCGSGLAQKEPFRLKKEPNWGRKKLFSLNWVYDEYFAKADFFQTLKRYDIEHLPVQLYKKDSIIESILQMKIPVVKNSLNLLGRSFIVCNVCHKKRYDLINDGFCPTFEDVPHDLHIFKSMEDFGSGANTRKYVFVSQALREEFLSAGIKANYIPQQ